MNRQKGREAMEYVVGEAESGKRLREILRGSAGVSRTALKSAKWNGRLFLNGAEAHTDAVARAGDRIRIDWAEPEPVYRLTPCFLPFGVAYEDDHLLVADKPAGMASQSSRNHPDDSLENAVFARAGCPEDFIYRPVNRLDKGTGGLMVIARTPHCQHLLQKQLHTSAFRRRYLALAEGCPKAREGILRLPIRKAEGATIRREVHPEGKPSVTRYRVLSEKGGDSLMLLELETGRTHQIRVHLSAIGCPVAGDFLYGREDPERFPGCFALHSAGLELYHPMTGETLRLTSIPAWAGELDPAVLLVDFH